MAKLVIIDDEAAILELMSKLCRAAGHTVFGYTTGMERKAGQSAPIALETPNGLSNVRATVAMARTSVPDSATSEFFINLVDNSATLDYRSPASPGYAVFGTVIQGMDVIDSIATQPTGTFNGFQDVPLTDVTITIAVQVK